MHPSIRTVECEHATADYVDSRDAETMRLERQRSGGCSQADINQHHNTMRAVFESMPGDGYFMRVLGLFHANLMDIPYWSRLFSQMGFTGPINGQRAHDIINAYSLAFFDQYLKARLIANLKG